MTCTQIREWLGPYLDGESSADVCRNVESHIEMCPTCAQELESLREVAKLLARPEPVVVPSELWNGVEQRLARTRIGYRPHMSHSSRRLLAAAALVFIAVGLGLFTLPWGGQGVKQVEAATVDFGVLLDGLKADAHAAFESFLKKYDAKEVSAAEAQRVASDLNFDIPDTLPGGFRRVSAYTLRFGNKPGAAARYARDSEFLGVLFHEPVLKEHFGTHEDRDCIVGQHRGHAVEVGEWSLVHLTDPTTCHCVLSRLNPETELPEVMAVIAPGSHE